MCLNTLSIYRSLFRHGSQPNYVESWVMVWGLGLWPWKHKANITKPTESVLDSSSDTKYTCPHVVEAQYKFFSPFIFKVYWLLFFSLPIVVWALCILASVWSVCTQKTNKRHRFFWENSVLSGCKGSGLRDGVTIQQSNNRRLISVWFQASVAQGSDGLLVQQTCMCSALIFSPSPLTAFQITLARSFKRAMTLCGTWSR